MNKCILCQSSVDEPLTFGEFIRAENIQVHYFCLVRFGRDHYILAKRKPVKT
jgi:hypothetical protein